MEIPDEDLGPTWLRDWEHIEADIQAMDDFAKKLRAEVETNYVSHLTPLYDDMSTSLPPPSAAFPELFDLLATHRQATETATNNVHDHANRSAGMAQVASDISANYGRSDAFAQATVSDVDKALGAAGAGVPGPGGRPGSAPHGGATIPTAEGY